VKIWKLVKIPVILLLTCSI